MNKLKIVVSVVLGISITGCNTSPYSQPEHLRFQDKKHSRNEVLQVKRDAKLCAEDIPHQQNCPIQFFIDDINSGHFFINNSAKYVLKNEIYNLKVKNCIDECQVCEADVRPKDLQDGRIIISLDDQELPIMLNEEKELICERNTTPVYKLEEKSTTANAQDVPKEMTIKVNLAVDTLFKFDGSSRNDLLQKGYQEIIEVANKIKTDFISVYQINLIGHTDRLGNDLYNQNLGARRADTVRDLLVQYGVERNIITTNSAGKNMPVTDGCRGMHSGEELKGCLQPDRRVTVEITGISK